MCVLVCNWDFTALSLAQIKKEICWDEEESRERSRNPSLYLNDLNTPVKRRRTEAAHSSSDEEINVCDSASSCDDLQLASTRLSADALTCHKTYQPQSAAEPYDCPFYYCAYPLMESCMDPECDCPIIQPYVPTLLCSPAVLQLPPAIIFDYSCDALPPSSPLHTPRQEGFKALQGGQTPASHHRCGWEAPRVSHEPPPSKKMKMEWND